MIMTRLALIVFVALWVNLAVAQTKGGNSDWQDVINGARKEGKVVVAGSPDPVMRNDVIPKFTSRYGITVELIAGRSSQIASRVETERAAGIYSVDLYLARARHLGQRIIQKQHDRSLAPAAYYARGYRWC